MGMPLAPAAPLLLIGGSSAAQPADLLRVFTELAGGRGAHVAVITSGSRSPQTVGPRYERLFGGFGARVTVHHLLDRATANRPDSLPGLEIADAFFFTGGEQLCITARLGGTAALAAIRRRHAAGAILGGTSAGTSVMSQTMIAFGAEGATPRHDRVNLAPGLGFLAGVVLDQHFSQRGRLGRLITAVSYNPEELGIGIDEDTGALFQPDGTLEVVGPHTVTVVDALDVDINSSPDVEDMSHPLLIEGLHIHRLVEGARFDLLGRAPRAAVAAA
ncbi:MAG TPA: cyanophycinase [Chloroflexia bacterium]|nr:cyanophycinase [Chloroflexia bacterium]